MWLKLFLFCLTPLIFKKDCMTMYNNNFESTIFGISMADLHYFDAKRVEEKEKTVCELFSIKRKRNENTES